MNTAEIEFVEEAVKKAVGEALNEWTKSRGMSELLTTAQVARIFQVAVWTVRDWQNKGLLKGRVQLLSGRSYRMMFESSDIIDFMRQNLPRPEDFTTRPLNGKATDRFIRMEQLYRRRRKVKE
jgi:hypothetical protein